jgi:hypothetical protein
MKPTTANDGPKILSNNIPGPADVRPCFFRERLRDMLNQTIAATAIAAMAQPTIGPT